METKHQELISFGPVHLRVTDLQRSILFWTEMIKLQLRNQTEELAELGTAEQTLVVLKAGAKRAFLEGYSGLYHLAIHISTEAEFARLLQRLINFRYPIAPTDHIMSKAIYMLDPDGITIEITLETPELFDRYNMQAGQFQVIDAQGQVRGATEALDVGEVLEHLPDNNLELNLPEDTKLGHVHVFVNDLQQAYDFYQQLGFLDNLISTQIGFADLSAGGEFKHRMAMNTWQSLGKPQAPDDSAGMDYFTIHYQDHAAMKENLAKLTGSQESDEGIWVTDPAGNKILILK